MFQERAYQLFAFIFLFAVSSFSAAKDGDILFKDDFNRADAGTVGNDWITSGPALLKGKALHFQLDEGEFRPRARRTFPKRAGGTFKVSFRFDWLRENEGSWGFFMQLGNGAKMPKSLIYERDLTKGVGVNLAWGGRELVGGGGRPLEDDDIGQLGQALYHVHIHIERIPPVVVDHDRQIALCRHGLEKAEDISGGRFVVVGSRELPQSSAHFM